MDAKYVLAFFVIYSVDASVSAIKCKKTSSKNGVRLLNNMVEQVKFHASSVYTNSFLPMSKYFNGK